ARSRETGGTGLGLSLVRHAVLRGNGTIEIESALGEGSTFRITLPLA
ncbi:MAG: ATP-binding protein, partial [Coriobacteriales bacterium]|nr:ATP-binding protein [Coriobacteriales bacterium]